MHVVVMSDQVRVFNHCLVSYIASQYYDYDQLLDIFKFTAMH